MSHYFPGHWEVTDYFYMSLNDYMEKKAFENFDMNPEHLEKEDVLSMVERMKSGEKIRIEECMANPAMAYAYRMQEMIKKAGGTLLWQFNAVDSKLEGYIRQVVCLGEKSLVRWSWYDAHVRLPLLRRKARLLNYLRRHKAQKEWDDWQKYLDELHNKRKQNV